MNVGDGKAALQFRDFFGLGGYAPYAAFHTADELRGGSGSDDFPLFDQYHVPRDVFHVRNDVSGYDNYLVEGKDSFIDNVIRLVHDLGMKMIVEGVEHKRQFERLKDFGADTIQGYYFSKPIPPEEAINFRVDSL